MITVRKDIPLPPRQSPALVLPLVLAAAKLVLHLGLSGRYGYHRDELYFIECGKHLSFGYVDHAPLVPWLARFSGELFGSQSLFALRFFSAIAGALAVFLTVRLVEQFGGGRFAQFTAGLAMLAAPAYLRMGSLLCLPVFEVCIWTAASYLIVRLVREDNPKLWPLVGFVAGLGLLNKHTMLLWGLGLAVGLVATEQRKQLRSPWLWAGAALALTIFIPNLLWQQRHQWATLEFITHINDDQLRHIPRSLFLLGQLLYMGPAALPVWAAGLCFFFSATGTGRLYRPLGWIFLTALLVLLVTHGKPYYLAPAYPPLFAGGAVLLERVLAGRRWARRGLLVGLLLVGGFTAMFSLPLLPLRTADRLIEGLLGSVVRPTDLTMELHDEYGWPEQAAAVAQVYRQLPRLDQARCAILTRNYGQASAVNFFAAPAGVPRAVSGHMTYYLWGPPAQSDVVIAYGLPLADLQAFFEEVREAAVPMEIHPLAPPAESGLKIYVCRRPKRPLSELWPLFKRYYHGAGLGAGA